MNDYNFLYLSRDGTIKSWDPRMKLSVGTHIQGESVYTIAVNDEKLVVGTAGRRTLVWDLRNMSTALQKRESSLKYQTRCIKCFPNRQGYVLSSIEGLCGVLINYKIVQSGNISKSHRTRSS